MLYIPLVVINTDKIYFDLTIVCALSNLYTARASYSLVAGSQNELSTYYQLYEVLYLCIVCNFVR